MVPTPRDATGAIPAVALKDEERRLSERPVRLSAADHALRETATVTPIGTVSCHGASPVATTRQNFWTIPAKISGPHTGCSRAS